MISSERLKQLLQNSEIIKAVEEVKEKKLFDNSYLMVFQGDLVINENDGIAVYIAIPQNWELDLMQSLQQEKTYSSTVRCWDIQKLS